MQLPSGSAWVDRDPGSFTAGGHHSAHFGVGGTPGFGCGGSGVGENANSAGANPGTWRGMCMDEAQHFLDALTPCFGLISQQWVETDHQVRDHHEQVLDQFFYVVSYVLDWKSPLHVKLVEQQEETVQCLPIT